MTKLEQYNKYMQELIKEQCNNNLTFKCTWSDIEKLYKENWNKFFKKKYNQEGVLIFVKSMRVLITQANKTLLENMGYKKFENRIVYMFNSFRQQVYTYYRVPDFLDNYYYQDFNKIRNIIIGTYDFDKIMQTWVELGLLKYEKGLLVNNSYEEMWELIKEYPRNMFLKSKYFITQVENYVADCWYTITIPQKELYELFRYEVFKVKPITRELVLNSDVKVPTIDEINKEFREKLDRIKI